MLRDFLEAYHVARLEKFVKAVRQVFLERLFLWSRKRNLVLGPDVECRDFYPPR